MQEQIYKTENGVQVSNAPLTTGISTANTSLLRGEIDTRVTRIRPMATPIDQLSRHADVRHAGSMKVGYYAVDVKRVSTATNQALKASEITGVADNAPVVRLHVADAAIFSVSETLLVPDAKLSGKPLMLYVTAVSTDNGTITARVVNEVEEAADIIAAVPSGSQVVRMGRAAAELDVQTPQFEALPVKRTNFCQIFKIQVEESTLHRLSNKEAAWTFSDQEEVAIIDMRQGMEKNFLFGIKAQFTNGTGGDDIYLTEGIWNQAGLKEHRYNPKTLTEEELIGICREVFTGTNGSARKILVGGSALIEALSCLPKERVVAGARTLVRWGLEFHEIKSNFGTLYVIHSEIFDQCGHEADGMIIDPNLITKYVHLPMQAERLNLRQSGQRNTDAVVLTEASCLVLRNPASHMRIVADGTLQLTPGNTTIIDPDKQ